MAFIKAFSRFTQYFPSSLKKDKINQVGKIKQILRYNSLSKENVSVNELVLESTPNETIFDDFYLLYFSSSWRVGERSQSFVKT